MKAKVPSARRRKTRAQGHGLNGSKLRAPRPKIEARSATSRAKRLRYVYWRDGQVWLGHLEEFPDYLTQGLSLVDLQEHLRDLHFEITSGKIPSVRRIAELEVA